MYKIVIVAATAAIAFILGARYGRDRLAQMAETVRHQGHRLGDAADTIAEAARERTSDAVDRLADSTRDAVRDLTDRLDQIETPSAS